MSVQRQQQTFVQPIKLTHPSSKNAKRFTEDLSDKNSLKRTTNCPTYFQALQEMIFQLDYPNTVYQVRALPITFQNPRVPGEAQTRPPLILNYE